MQRSLRASYRHVVRVSMVVIILLPAGCDNGLPETAPVRGMVEYDGKPLADAQYGGIVLTPQGGKIATGELQSDGAFVLSTYTEGGGDGAIVGPARLAVTAALDSPTATTTEKHQGVHWMIPRNFTSGDTSGLTCEVQPGVDNVFRIKLSSDGTGTVDVESAP